jgi:peroxiredoxin
MFCLNISAPHAVSYAHAQTASPFSSLQWTARILVVTGEHEDPLYTAQIQNLRDRLKEVQDRDIAVLHFNRDSIRPLSEFGDYGYAGWYRMNANQRRFVRDTIELTEENTVFSVVLIGKDGEVKSVWQAAEDAVSADDIFTIIDSMPMRQREMGNAR